MDYLKYFKNDTLFEGNDNFFKKYIKKSYIYGEYGCGQSTYWVLKNTNVKIYSVDTSKHWINKLHKSKLTSKDRIDLKLINLGKIESWGYPVNYSKRDNFYKYTNWIWTQSELPDTILIRQWLQAHWPTRGWCRRQRRCRAIPGDTGYD